MTQRMQDLIGEILRLQDELEAEIDQRREALGWRLRERFVEFEEGIAAEHRRLKTSAARFLAESSIASILTAPVIYSLIVPLVALDLWANLYQQICFRAYGIPRVRRADYVVFDRARLAYLNWIEALNCRYCSYANGVVAFVREIASRTEQYWCPIKHALKATDPHRRYVGFLDYGDADGYRTRLEDLRTLLREETARADAETPAPKA
jgi:hypothetical protein